MRRVIRAERWVRPGIDDDEEEFVPPTNQPATINVETSDDPVWTGLLDASGNKIYREREPIGFRFCEND